MLQLLYNLKAVYLLIPILTNATAFIYVDFEEVKFSCFYSHYLCTNITLIIQFSFLLFIEIKMDP